MRSTTELDNPAKGLSTISADSLNESRRDGTRHTANPICSKKTNCDKKSRLTEENYFRMKHDMLVSSQ